MTKATDILDAILRKAYSDGTLTIPYSSSALVMSAKTKLWARVRQIKKRHEEHGDLYELCEIAESLSISSKRSDPKRLVIMPKVDAPGMDEMLNVVKDDLAELERPDNVRESEKDILTRLYGIKETS